VNHSHFTDVVDMDGKIFSLRIIHSENELMKQPCYEMIRKNETTWFCYPQVVIAGIAKCGTSAMYSYLLENKNWFSGDIDKEICPKPTFYDFFKAFGETYISAKNRIKINGCIHHQSVLLAHKLLRPNDVAYIFMIRNASSFAWAGYNYWCNTDFENCSKPGVWASNMGFSRSPEHFDQYVRTKNGRYSCSTFNSVFTEVIEIAAGVIEKMPLVVSLDAIESTELRLTQLQRVQNYIIKELKVNITFDSDTFRRVNSGATSGDRGVATVPKHPVVEGLYEISGFRPLLPKTIDYINNCWKECSAVSNMSHFPYRCAS
jgi:hypothetical protein